MAVFPREAHVEGPDGQDHFLRRWPVFAIALLILLLGSLPGIVREAELWRSLQASGSNSDALHLAKREPLRALAALERKEGQASQWLGADGMLVPAADTIVAPGHLRITAQDIPESAARLPFWPAPLPRAPPRTV
jgi:hypothetical protein